MAASWEMLRLAIAEKDYSMATSTLCQELECESADLAPMLSGILAEVIRKDEAAKAKRVQKGSAFSRFNGSLPQECSASQAPAEATDVARRCWRSGLRSLFSGSAQAATAMLADLADEYSSDEFVRRAGEVNDGWSAGATSNSQKVKDIDHLCLQVGKPVLERYGFSPDVKGDRDFRSILQELSKTSKEVRDMNNRNRRLVFSAFPGLRDQDDDSDEDSVARG
mmetsp:Transcript_53639/g.160121  ORF Transcript_53639/g.160121 Transcript_53639/m.160121 type:complete len:223 (+) Transcript_53639:81-749(+)